MALKLTKDDLSTVSWWELAGHDPESLAEAWRATHYASQAVAEVGKAFALPKDDDSHTNLEWFGGENLLDGFLAGSVVGTNRRIRAALRLWDMRLFLIEPNGRAHAELGLTGETLEASLGWVVSAAMDVLDEPIRQATDPAPDLPDDPLGAGGEFSEAAGIAQAELIRLYANTSALLERVRDRLTDQGVETEPVRTWPHHFDMAALVNVKQNDDGETLATVGLGLTPPDGTVAKLNAGDADEGYWYVSAWTKHESSADAPADLPFGRWLSREGKPPMAVLALSDVSSTEERAEQIDRIASFFASAFEASGALAQR